MYTCSCFFLDVGQGTSQILYLGAGRAIVIDTGAPTSSNSRFIEQALNERSITQIEALIISHSDADHFGNAAYLIQNRINMINRIYLVHDKNSETVIVKNFWAIMCKLFNGENGSLIRKKITPFNAPQTIWERNEEGSIVRMEILFPTYSHAIDGEMSNAPNNASAVLLFSVGERKILFTGDASFSSFQWIFDERGKIEADVVSVPHHGGKIGANIDQLIQLYSDYLSGSLAIISVGNRNTYQHPNPDTLDVLRNCGYEVLCTQITDCCCPIEKQEQWRCQRRYEGLQYSSSSRSVSNCNVACMGTVQIDLNSLQCNVVAPANYAQIKNDLRAIEGAKPFCKN